MRLVMHLFMCLVIYLESNHAFGHISGQHN